MAMRLLRLCGGLGEINEQFAFRFARCAVRANQRLTGTKMPV
jgi:hypothetical protein